MLESETRAVLQQRPPMLSMDRTTPWGIFVMTVIELEYETRV